MQTSSLKLSVVAAIVSASSYIASVPAWADSKPAAQAAAKQMSVNEQLLAAAEHFEALTEQAHNLDFKRLTNLHGRALSSLRGFADKIPPGVRIELDDQNKVIVKALAAGNRSALAIAAVESYRTLVNAQEAGAKVPTAVSLLDYAGFKFDALLKGKPVDWKEIADVMAFANQTWEPLANSVGDQKLRWSFAVALQAMEKAAKDRDSKAALEAVIEELALVDKLEGYFKSN